MAIINTYPTVTPKGADLAIGTQVKDDTITENSTKSFTVASINALAPQGTVTSIGLTETGSALTITGSPVTASGTINIAGAGSNSQVILGDLTLGTYTTGTMSSFSLTADNATTTVIQEGDTIDIEGGTKITTAAALSDTLTVNHDNTTRSDTTSTASPAAGGTFTCVDSITQDATGHPTAVNVKTVTLPAGVGYTSYVAIVTQASTNAPAAIVLSNNTGLTFTWTRNNTGIYELGFSSNVDPAKVWTQITGGNTAPSDSLVSLKNTTASSSIFHNVLITNANLTDGIAAAFIEIRIYP